MRGCRFLLGLARPPRASPVPLAVRRHCACFFSSSGLRSAFRSASDRGTHFSPSWASRFRCRARRGDGIAHCRAPASSRRAGLVVFASFGRGFGCGHLRLVLGLQRDAAHRLRPLLHGLRIDDLRGVSSSSNGPGPPASTPRLVRLAEHRRGCRRDRALRRYSPNPSSAGIVVKWTPRSRAPSDHSIRFSIAIPIVTGWPSCRSRAGGAIFECSATSTAPVSKRTSTGLSALISRPRASLVERRAPPPGPAR